MIIFTYLFQSIDDRFAVFFYYISEFKAKVLFFIFNFLICAVISYCYSGYYILMLTEIFKSPFYIKTGYYCYFILNNIMDLFRIKVLCSVFLSLLISLSTLFCHFFIYLIPILYLVELYKLFKWFLIYIIINCIFYFLLFELLLVTVLDFFIENFIEIGNLNLSLYLDYELSGYCYCLITSFVNIQLLFILILLTFYFSLSIELPVFYFRRSYIYILILFCGAILTPPDIYSQLSIGFVVALCYEILIYIQLYKVNF